MKVKLRPPLITLSRAKVSMVILAVAWTMETGDPRPFNASGLAKIFFVALAAEIIRQYVVWRMEVSVAAVQRVEEFQRAYIRRRDRIDTNVRYRIRRALYTVALLLVMGTIIDGATDRCEGTLQCISLAPAIAYEAAPAALQVALYIAIGMVQLFAMFYSMTKVGFYKVVLPGTIRETFDDVWGQDAARDRAKELIRLLEDDTEIAKAGAYVPGGAVFWGPPGTGKTLIAKAMAAACRFPLILVPPGGFASTFVGINFLKVIDLFKKIRKLSLRHGGVICFMDEIDSLGNRGGISDDTAFQMPTVGQAIGALLRFEREPYVWKKKWVPGEPDTACTAAATASASGHWDGVWVDRKTGEVVEDFYPGGSSGMNTGTLESILAALDGFDEPRGLINKVLTLLGFKALAAPIYKRLIIGATNRLEAMDKALLRPGRLDYQIHVGYPDFNGKVHTYEGYLRDKSHELTAENVAWAARNHHHGTGAEIKHIVNEAVLMTFRDSDREDKGTVTFDDLKRATLWVRYGESKGQFEWDRNRRSVAIHEASHAVAMHHLRRDTEEIWMATVEQFGKTGGFVSPSPKYDDWKQLRSDMLNDIQVSLASRVGERLLVGEMSNGHGGDGPHATLKAQQMVRLGHGSTIGFYGPESRPKGEWQGEVEAILQEAERAVTALLEPRTEQITALADLLMEKGIVDGETIHELLGSMEVAA